MNRSPLIDGPFAFFLVLCPWLCFAFPVAAAEEFRLAEPFAPGYQYHVSCRVDLSGSLNLPPEKGQATTKSLAVTGSSAIEYDERVLKRDVGQVQKTARVYRRIDFKRKVGTQLQESTIRPTVRRMVVLRHKNIGVPFSPDGPLLWAEIDLVRTDVFTPALTGLLPDGLVRAGSRWTAATTAIQELTALGRIEEGRVACKFEQIATLGRRRYARISFSGTVRGSNEDGPNRQHLDGYLFFDLDSPHISYLYLKGTQALLDAQGQVQGKVVGYFTLTRQAPRRSRDLEDVAWRGVELEPNDSNTLLLYDNPELGVRLLYPRRWRVAGVRGRQLALDEARGNGGLLMTLEPSNRVPTAAQFLQESRTWLGRQKAREYRVESPRRLQNGPQNLDHFAVDAEVARERVWLDYFVLQQPPGGAAIAARLLPRDQAALRREVEGIARSVRITRTIAAEPRK